MKLNRKTYYLICLIEECAEVIHRTCKAIRFGMDDVQSGQAKSNQERLDEEMTDLIALRHINITAGNLTATSVPCRTAEQIQNKLNKVNKYMEYSREKGTLEE